MRILSTLAAAAALAGGVLAQPPKGEVPMPMPVPDPKAKVVPDMPHKIFVGEWEMVQYLRPFQNEMPIPKGTIEFRDDQTFVWKMYQGDTIAGRFQVVDEKIMMTRKTPLGETFTYNFTHLDIVDGKVVRPIGANCYEEWSRVPPKAKKN